MTTNNDADKTGAKWGATILLLMILSMPLLSLLSALIYREAWNITLATQYGDGPTLKSWFGISLVVMMLIWSLRPKEREGQATKKDVLKVIRELVASYVMRLLFLLLAWGTCWVLGW